MTFDPKNTTGKYVLAEDGRTPVPEPDLLKWARWFETAKRHVADDEVGPLRVSTVFLGLDHAFGFGHPVLWETMIFGAPESFDSQWRYTTYKDAVKGHARAIKLARSYMRKYEEKNGRVVLTMSYIDYQMLAMILGYYLGYGRQGQGRPTRVQ